MFDKIKQLGQLRALQKELQSQKFTAERNGIKVTINGSMSVEEIILDAGRSPEQQQGDLVYCINDAMRAAQKGVAEKMQGMGLGM